MMKKRHLGFVLTGSLLATMSLAGPASAEKTVGCGSSEAKVVWSPDSTSSILDSGLTVVGNPDREPGAYYCTRIRTQDGVLVVGAKIVI